MSFRLKTILGIAAIEGVLLLSLVLGSIDILRSSNEESLQQRAQTLARAFAVISGNAVVFRKHSLMQTALDEVATEKGVIYARLKDVDGNILIAIDLRDVPGQAFVADRTVRTRDDDIFETSAPIVENGLTVGRAELGVSTAFINTMISSSVMEFMIIAGIGIFVTIVFAYVFGSHLTRQLQTLRATSSRIADGGSGEQVPVSGDAEIADTIRAFNGMSARLKSYYDEVKFSERRMRSIFDNVALAVTTFEADGTILEFNAPAEWIFGHAAEDVIGNNICILMDTPSRLPFTALMEDCRSRPADERLEFQLNIDAVRKDGRLFPIELIISRYVFDGADSYTMLMRDVSAEKTLMQKSLQAQSVFENIGDAIVITDSENKVVQVNPAYTRITGFGAHDVIGQTRRISRTESLDHDFFATIWESLTENGIWSGEVWDARKNGEIFPAWMTTTELTSDTGEVTNYISTFRDITESKKVERIKQEFVSTVSHELRTPVTSIKGSLGILQSGAFGPLPEKAAKMLTLAANNCDRLILLINDILDMAKIESGTVGFKMKPVNLNAFLDEAIASCQHYGEDRDIRIKRTGAALSALLLADKGRLVQVMANLMSNAVKFSPDGGTVRVSTKRLDGAIRISVSDDGPGIPPAFHSQLFEKFTQSDASDGRSRGGTGLGLSIAKAIVDMHGGSIHFVTQEGKGTTFNVDLTETKDHIQSPKKTGNGPRDPQQHDPQPNRIARGSTDAATQEDCLRGRRAGYS
ncbi:PAS domain S-box protein [Breoghania sp. L-A4]|uniref:PAS domain S-box protein n=1 Tax=Breoghania sp. L-A4 TaxID=2304600 RepID=UPI000E35AD97|nr:PAS domain S-box protein [Breoghania sp. L-A4]AXS39852.1 PAS domain S-box protein [Breoghania sp. L-A4]